jgi:steroid delta-isomerase-like uncharacterized protein
MNTTEKNKKIAKRFYDEVMNDGKLNVIDELVADNYVEHEEFAGLPQNKEGVKQFVNLYRNAFPDLKADVQHIIAEDDKVVILYNLSGTHKGEFLGNKASGRRFELPYADVVRFKDGKATEHWGYADSIKMIEQLQIDLTPAHN